MFDYSKYYRKHAQRIRIHRHRKYKLDKLYREKINRRALRYGMFQRFDESIRRLYYENN